MAYHSSYCLAEKGKKSWAAGVKNLLFSYGFGEVWYSQGVGNDKKKLTEFSQRLKDCFQQNWHDEMVSTENLAICSILKYYHSAEMHMLSMENRCRSVLLKLRASVCYVCFVVERGKLINFSFTPSDHTRDKSECEKF